METARPDDALSCRMYEQKYPEVEDLVVVMVREVAEMGAYVSLLEYNNIDGMILLSELSRRRIRSISKLIRVGRQEVVVVLRVDKEKGYIDLSKRRVSPEDIAKCEEKYNKSKTVHSIMRHVAETMQLRLEDLYVSFGWPLYRKFGHAYDAFKLAISEPRTVFEGLNISDDILNCLLMNIRRRLTPQPVKLRADIEVTCFKYDGIDAIRDALSEGERCSTEEFPIEIRLVAPPLYVMTTTTLEKNRGIQCLENACQAIKKCIEARNGHMTIKVQARAVTERDDKSLTSLMDQLGRQNVEVSGDDDHDSGDETLPGGEELDEKLPEPSAAEADNQE